MKNSGFKKSFSDSRSVKEREQDEVSLWSTERKWSYRVEIREWLSTGCRRIARR